MTLTLPAVEQLPTWFMAASLALLGAIWGSFASALCHRWPLGESIIGGRSRCDSCGKALRPHELVPILSFLVQRGKCRICGATIAPDILLFELGCALVGLVCALLFAPLAAFGMAMFCWLLLPLVLLDWRHNWLPDALIIVLALAALLVTPISHWIPQLSDRILGGIAGFAFLEGLRRGYSALRGIDAMGAGDPKLFGALGLWVGWQALPILLLMTSILGLADFARRYRRAQRADLKLPLGSYMGMAAIGWMCFSAVYRPF